MCCLMSLQHVRVFENFAWFSFFQKTPKHEMLFSRHALNSSAAWLVQLSKPPPQGRSTPNSSIIIPIITTKNLPLQSIYWHCSAKIRLVVFVSSTHGSHVRSELLSVGTRSMKGKRRRPFICMQAARHREGIWLRHRESRGLHEARGEHHPAVSPTWVKQYCLCLTGFTQQGSNERQRETDVQREGQRGSCVQKP